MEVILHCIDSIHKITSVYLHLTPHFVHRHLQQCFFTISAPLQSLIYLHWFITPLQHSNSCWQEVWKCRILLDMNCLISKYISFYKFIKRNILMHRIFLLMIMIMVLISNLNKTLLRECTYIQIINLKWGPWRQWIA